MVIQSINKFYCDDESLGKIIKGLKIYDLSYAFNKYVDKERWTDALGTELGVNNIFNVTDFNYSKCFNYVINDKDLNVNYFGDELIEFLSENEQLYRTEIMISIIAPVLFYRFHRLFLKKGKVNFESSIEPYTTHQSKLHTSVLSFCEANSLFLVSDFNLKKSLDGMSLEMSGDSSLVYNLLFEDTDIGFPYG